VIGAVAGVVLALMAVLWIARGTRIGTDQTSVRKDLQTQLPVCNAELEGKGLEAQLYELAS
jgi:hypothetical protein